jgi:DNA-directed RNA polymerase subunit RPC12/RpoP
MKPRTKLQVEVMAKSQELHYEENFILEWAKVDCLQHKGYATKSRVVCMDCGGRFSSELVKRKYAVCPHCGQKLSIEHSRKTTFEQDIYVGYAQVIGEYQVVRYFEIQSYHKADKPTKYFSWEILQHWIREDGKHETVARNHTANWYCDSWNGDMSIRKDYHSYYENAKKYDIYTEAFHPQSVFRDQYKKHGINRHLAGLTFMEAIKTIPDNPRFETLLKSKQYNLLSVFYDRKYVRDGYWPAIKICIRNKYIVKDAKMWIDYIDLLSYFNKDLHNSHYVCPKDIKQEHDRYMIKKREVENRRAENAKRERAKEANKQYIETKGAFFGICFGDGKIKIKVLESVQEFMKEGDTLHHCVFTNNYYSHQDALILSARINNQPIETIEVSLSKMKIEQSRGLQNAPSQYHEKIIALVNRNLHKIKEVLNQSQSIAV